MSCRITVTSVGTAAPTGPVRVADAATVLGAGAPVQILTVTPDGAEWACGPVPANSLSCQIPGAVMTPGTSRHFDVTVQSPTFGRFENCARGSWGPAPGGDIVYPFGEACAQGGTTINVEKTGDKECQVGEPCTFEITITNTARPASPVRSASVTRSAWTGSAAWKAFRSARSYRPSAARPSRRRCLCRASPT